MTWKTPKEGYFKPEVFVNSMKKIFLLSKADLLKVSAKRTVLMVGSYICGK